MKRGMFLGVVERNVGALNDDVLLIQKQEETYKVKENFQIGKDNYRQEERQSFIDFLVEYKCLFSSYSEEVGTIKGVKNEIGTTSDRPIIMRQPKDTNGTGR